MIKNMGLDVGKAVETDNRHMPKPPCIRKDNYVNQAKKDRDYYRKLGYTIPSSNGRRT